MSAPFLIKPIKPTNLIPFFKLLSVKRGGVKTRAMINDVTDELLEFQLCMRGAEVTERKG